MLVIRSLSPQAFKSSRRRTPPGINFMHVMFISTASMETGSAEGRRFKVRTGGWNLNRIRRRRIVPHDDHIPVGDDIYDLIREARASKPPLCTVIQYMSPLVLAVVTLRCQGRTECLFEKNLAPTWCFFVTTCVYWLIVEVMDQIQIFTTKWPQIFRRAAIASGVFSLVSQASIFLPPSVSIVPLMVCAALQPVILAWPLLCYAYDLVQKGIASVFYHVCAKKFLNRGCNLNEVSLPVSVKHSVG